jgi:hypothetical protein
MLYWKGRGVSPHKVRALKMRKAIGIEEEASRGGGDEVVRSFGKAEQRSYSPD